MKLLSSILILVKQINSNFLRFTGFKVFWCYLIPSFWYHFSKSSQYFVNHMSENSEMFCERRWSVVTVCHQQGRYSQITSWVSELHRQVFVWPLSSVFEGSSRRHSMKLLDHRYSCFMYDLWPLTLGTCSNLSNQLWQTWSLTWPDLIS